MQPSPTPPAPLLDTSYSLTEASGQGDAVPPWQLARHVSLCIPEDVPPPDVANVVMAAGHLEVVVVGHGVVGPPDPAGHPVGHQAVYGVVAPGHQQHGHARHGQQEGEQVEDKKLLGTRRV